MSCGDAWRGALRLTLAVGCLGAGLEAPLHAQQRTTSESIQALLGDSTQYREVITAFQAAVKAHDAAGVAALVRYPIKVRIGGSKRTIRTPQKFIAKYDSIITPAITAAVQDQPYGDMMVNSKGVMLGRREVWINGVCRDTACRRPEVRVITIQGVT
jgi:hypothetical protein